MEESLFESVPEYKIYNETAVRIGTFLGGPLVAGYLIAENFRSFGEIEKVTRTWVYSIIVTVVLFGGIFLVPDLDKIPSYIIPIAYALIASFLVKHYQGDKINKHIASHGQFYSIGRAILIGLIGTVITVGIIFVILLISNQKLSL